MLLVRNQPGATRWVFFLGPWAIKIPALWDWRSFLHGLLANMQERLWASMGYPGLCPLICSLPGGWLIVMRRAEPLSREEWNGLSYEAFVDKGNYQLPVENKLDSFGKLGDQIVAVDYGGWC